MGDGDGSDAPGLGAGDHARYPTSGLEAHFGKLGALAASGLTGYDNDRIFPDGFYDLFGTSAYWELFRERNARHASGTKFFFLDRSGQLLLQFLQFMQSRVFFCAALALLKSAQPAADISLVSQKSIRQKRTDPVYDLSCRSLGPMCFHFIIISQCSQHSKLTPPPLP